MHRCTSIASDTICWPFELAKLQANFKSCRHSMCKHTSSPQPHHGPEATRLKRNAHYMRVYIRKGGNLQPQTVSEGVAAVQRSSDPATDLKESASKNSLSPGDHCHSFQVDFLCRRRVPSSRILSKPGSKLTVMVVPLFSSAASAAFRAADHDDSEQQY